MFEISETFKEKDRQREKMFAELNRNMSLSLKRMKESWEPYALKRNKDYGLYEEGEKE